MKLSQALTKIKNLKSKLSRIDKIIDSCTIHYEDEKPEYSYVDEVAKRGELILSICDLKEKVQMTNVATDVVWQGEVISLARLILINADTRSAMAWVQKQLDLSLQEEHSWRAQQRSKDDIKKVYADGYSKAQLRTTLEDLELMKEQIDGLMADTNASTDLL